MYELFVRLPGGCKIYVQVSRGAAGLKYVLK